jgi:glycosyltransferase involved in cell wall biosynthesis
MNSLNVLHVNTWGGVGGAFIASDRLHTGLLRQNINSHLVYGSTLNNSDKEISKLDTYQKLVFKQNKIEDYLIRLCKRLGLNDIGKISTLQIHKQNYYQQASILNFHNLHSDYFSYLALPLLTADKPAVLTLHDMWSFTGHCAYSYDCSKWKSGCGKCPYPNSEPSVRRDATALEWRIKNWVYRHSNITVVAPSAWLAERAQQSILNRFPVHHIPYGIDLNIYQPLSSAQCRSQLGLPIEKNIVMFGAQSLNNSRKGGDLLLKAIHSLPDSLKAETVLLTIGENSNSIAEIVGMETFNLGYIEDEHLKAIAYSAADLFIFPTRADNLPLVLQESMACGTPMVSFDTGGVPDLVRPGITGYLAQPENVEDLCSGIVQMLRDKEKLQQMRHNCRNIAVEEYSIELQSTRYINLYRKIVNN